MLSRTVKQIIVFTQLITVTLSTFVLTYVPSSLQDSIQKEFNIDASKFGLLVSVCNWTSLLDVVHGYLLDRFLGIKLASFLYAITLLIGCILFSVAGFTKSFWLLLAGRTIYGFGLNPMVLCTNKHIILWFGRGKNINLVYSVNESVFWLGISVCYFSSISLYKAIKKHQSQEESLGITICTETMIFCFLAIFGTLSLAFMHHSEGTSENINLENNSELKENRTWKDYLSLSKIFWIFAFVLFIYFISILGFLNMSQVFFEKTYKVDTTTANNLSALITFLGFFLSPPFGYLLDRVGLNLYCLTAAYLFNLAAHVIFTWYKHYPLIPVIIMAISLVFSCSMWSQFQYLVAEHQYMIAYGIAQTGLFFALSVGTIISGYLIDAYGYEGFMLFLFVLIVGTLPALILIWILDYKRGSLLNLNPQKKLEYLGRTK